MPRPGRAYWKGFLRLSLVSIPVEIHTAVDAAGEIHLNQIHKPSGKRVNYTKTVQGIGPVQAADIIKGYEIDKDIYVTLEPEEIDALRLDTKHTLDLQQFIDAAEIDQRYFEKPYYIVPADDHATEGYLVIREALRDMNKLGVGQITMGGREHIVTVGPVDKGLVMETLRYVGEIKSPGIYFGDLPAVKLDKEMVALARELISRKAAPFAPEQFKDSYADALRALIDMKAKGQRIISRPMKEAPEGKVIDLLEALRKSIGTAAKSPDNKPGGKKPASKNDPKASRRAG